MPVWGHEGDAQLLLAILRNHEFKVDYKRLADDLSIAMNTEVNTKSIQNRIGSLKAGRVKTQAASSSANNSPRKTPTKPVTPRKRKQKEMTPEEESPDDERAEEEEITVSDAEDDTKKEEVEKEEESD